MPVADMPGPARGGPPHPGESAAQALTLPAVDPVRGLTILAVEDSRFAAEALRLMCRRIGLRLRRAEDLRSARLHLRLYRPDAVLIDLGLPDGRGETLIGELIASPWRPRAVLAASADPAGRLPALASGADGFLEKPLESLAAFRAALARVLPELADPPPLGSPAAPGAEDAVLPDPLALRDDLAHAAEVLCDRRDAEGQRYLAGFLGGVARHAHDAALARAAEGAAPDLAALLERRLAAAEKAFPEGQGLLQAGTSRAS